MNPKPSSLRLRKEVGVVRGEPRVVRVVGLEPTRLLAQEPKSCTSANSATPAFHI